jgi:MATE family multidrug resistance protein
MAIKGWFIGMQDTVSPMITDIVVNVVNMAVSYALAVHTPVGALGVAYGTVVAQLTGLLLSIVILGVKYRSVWQGLSIRQLLRDMQGIGQLMSLNANLFVRSLCFMIVYVGFTALSSKYGDTDLAVCSILMKLFMLVSYFVDGFAYAGEALVGKFIGEAKNNITDPKSSIANSQLPITNTPLASVVRLLFRWSLGVGAVFTFLFALAYMPMYRAMTSDAIVLERLTHFTGWLIAMPIVSTLAFMWDGVYAGATAGRQIRNAMIWAAIGFVVGYWLSPEGWSTHALFVGYFLHHAARVIYLTAMWRPLASKL